MKITLVIAYATLASCAALPSSAPAQGPTLAHANRIALYLGQRNLDEDDYDPVDKQPMFGIEYSHEAATSAIGWEIGLMGSTDEDKLNGTKVEGATGEVYGGIKKTFGDNYVRPYIGLGVSFIRSTVHVSGAGEDDDSSIAGYAHVGVTVDLTEQLYLGMDARILAGSNLQIAGVDTDADYGQLAFALGFAF